MSEAAFGLCGLIRAPREMAGLTAKDKGSIRHPSRSIERGSRGVSVRITQCGGSGVSSARYLGTPGAQVSQRAVLGCGAESRLEQVLAHHELSIPGGVKQG